MKIAWMVLGALVEVSIALIVLGAAEGRSQTLVLAGLAEIYAVIRYTHMGLAVGLLHFFITVESKNFARFIQLAKLLGDSAAQGVTGEPPESLAEMQKELQLKLYIQGGAQSIIAIAATYKLLMAAL